MERDYLSTDELIFLEFSQTSEQQFHQHENFEMLYVLEGTVQLSVENDTYNLKSKDIVIINYGRQHAYITGKGTLVARFVLSYTKLKEFLDNDIVLFWCNSTIEDSSRYRELGQLLDKILNCFVIEGTKRTLSKTSLYYQLFHTLVKKFLLTSDDIQYRLKKDSEPDRMQEIFQYIRTNYRQPITLQDLSDHFFLSKTYLSKFIKQKCEVGFVDILNSVRLSHAIVDLLNSDQSVLKVAMDNGFANVAAFNKVFKEAYNITPSKFRRSKKRELSNPQNSSDYQQLVEKVGDYLLGVEEETEEIVSSIQSIIVDHEGLASESWNNSFTQMINIGGAFDLTKVDFQEQVLKLKKELGIKYIRFWDIYAPRLHLDIHAGTEKINFSRLDTAIDFLITNNLIPYIELGFKPLRLLKSTNISLLEVERQNSFQSDNEMFEFMSNFIKHYINRYGYEEVEKWYFEYWKQLDVKVDESGNYVLNLTNTENSNRYFQQFSIIAKAFRAHLPEVQIGGGGFPIQHYERDGLTELFETWKEQEELPTFLSFTGYPYQIENERGTYYERRISDPSYLKEQLQMVKDILKQTGLSHLPTHVSEYGLTLSNRNPINDHSAKAAFLLQNAFLTSDLGNLFGYYLGSDLYNEFFDSSDFLFGGSGLLSKTGAAKPSFYAFKFLNQLSKEVYFKASDCIIARSRQKTYKVICHNMKKLNSNYYFLNEDDITVSKLPHLFEGNDDKEFHYSIRNVPNGSYVIKSQLVNEGSGSLQYEWKKYDISNIELTLDEMDYLKQISVPEMRKEAVSVKDNNLEFNIRLKPNEIRFLEIVRLD